MRRREKGGGPGFAVGKQGLALVWEGYGASQVCRFSWTLSVNLLEVLGAFLGACNVKDCHGQQGGVWLLM